MNHITPNLKKVDELIKALEETLSQSKEIGTLKKESGQRPLNQNQTNNEN